MLRFVVLLILQGCRKERFESQSNAPHVPQEVREILELSKGRWLADPATGEEIIHVQTREFSAEIFSIARDMHDREYHAGNRNRIKLSVMLGETDSPELYQFLDAKLVSSDDEVYDEIYRMTQFINVRIAFTLRASDAMEGLVDFHKLRERGLEWRFGKEYVFNLDELPLKFHESSSVVDPLGSLAYFFERYMYKGFRIIGMRIVFSKERPTLDHPGDEPNLGFSAPEYPELYKEFHFFLPTPATAPN